MRGVPLATLKGSPSVAALKGSPYVAFAVAAFLVPAFLVPAFLVARPFQGRLVAQRTPRATVYEGARLVDGSGSRKISKVYQRGAEVDRAALRAAWSKQ
jgi:hypothetical protein